MRIASVAVLVALTATAARAERGPITVPRGDVARISRTDFDATRGPRARGPSDRVDVPLHRTPPTPLPPPELGVVESVLGVIGLSAAGVLYLKAKVRDGGTTNWNRGGRSGYRSLTPSWSRVREVAVAPVVTGDGVHGGMTLRW